MRRTILGALAAGALALGGCASMDGGDAIAAGDLTPEAAMPFVMMAGASDLYEIESSRLALQRAQRGDVRQYAQMLIDHHTTLTSQVMAAAREAGLNPPPPQLMPMHQEMLSELRNVSAGGFDAAYLGQQVRAHEMALALHRNYAAEGDRPPLRAVAGNAIPVVAQHLGLAQQMAAR